MKIATGGRGRHKLAPFSPRDAGRGYRCYDLASNLCAASPAVILIVPVHSAWRKDRKQQNIPVAVQILRHGLSLLGRVHVKVANLHSLE